MRQTAAEFSALGVTEISRTVCELLEWKRPNGRLKNHECRQLLERLQAEGVLTLPALRNLGGRGPRRIDITQPGFQPEPLERAVSECEPLELALVEGRAESRLWREHVETLSLFGMPRAVRGELALLGAESRSGTGLPPVDLARLEDEAPRRLDRVERRATTTPVARDRQ